MPKPGGGVPGVGGGANPSAGAPGSGGRPKPAAGLPGATGGCPTVGAAASAWSRAGSLGGVPKLVAAGGASPNRSVALVCGWSRFGGGVVAVTSRPGLLDGADGCPNSGVKGWSRRGGGLGTAGVPARPGGGVPSEPRVGRLGDEGAPGPEGVGVLPDSPGAGTAGWGGGGGKSPGLLIKPPDSEPCARTLPRDRPRLPPSSAPPEIPGSPHPETRSPARRRRTSSRGPGPRYPGGRDRQLVVADCSLLVGVASDRRPTAARGCGSRAPARQPRLKPQRRPRSRFRRRCCLVMDRQAWARSAARRLSVRAAIHSFSLASLR